MKMLLGGMRFPRKLIQCNKVAKCAVRRRLRQVAQFPTGVLFSLFAPCRRHRLPPTSVFENVRVRVRVCVLAVLMFAFLFGIFALE